MSEVAAPAKAVNALTVTVVKLGKHPLRITELGAAALKNGDKFKVSTDLAKSLVKTYGAHLEVSEDVQKNVTLKNGTWEPIGSTGAPKKEKEDAGDKLADADTETVTKPANKDMAAKAAAKK